jgi:hypothetical protein
VTLLDDQFDLDVRLTVVRDGEHFGDRLNDRDRLDLPVGLTDAETVAPAQTCPADTCELGCETMTCPEETCGCNTAETCDQRLEDCAGGITFGQYCEDASGGDDTCDGCPSPVSDVCPDPPDE